MHTSMYMYGAYSTPEKGRSTSFLYNIMVAYRRGLPQCWTELRRRSCGDGGGCCTAMRGVGVQLGIVYWLLCAIYLFAALGSVVASGDSGAAAVQLAASAPALLVGAPLAAGRLVDSVVEAAVDTLAGESALFLAGGLVGNRVERASKSGGLNNVVQSINCIHHSALHNFAQLFTTRAVHRAIELKKVGDGAKMN